MAVPGRNNDGQVIYPELSAPVCGPCKDEGENIAAAGFCDDCNEYLCELCSQLHKRRRAYRDHKLQHIQPCQQVPDISNSDVNACSKHEGEIVLFYCRTHQEFGCGSCIIKNHKLCEDIVDVRDEYNSVDSNLKQLKLEYTKQAGQAEENSSRVEKIKEDAVNAIETFHGEIIDISNKLENVSMEEVEKLRNQDDDIIKAISEKCVGNLHDIDSLSADLGTLYEEKRTAELFRKMEDNRSQISQLETDLRTIQRDNIINEFKFEPSCQLSTMLQSLEGLGTMISGQPRSQRSYGTNKGWIVGTCVMLIIAMVIAVQFPEYPIDYLGYRGISTYHEKNNLLVPGAKLETKEMQSSDDVGQTYQENNDLLVSGAKLETTEMQSSDDVGQTLNGTYQEKNNLLVSGAKLETTEMQSSDDVGQTLNDTYQENNNLLVFGEKLENTEAQSSDDVGKTLNDTYQENNNPMVSGEKLETTEMQCSDDVGQSSSDDNGCINTVHSRHQSSYGIQTGWVVCGTVVVFIVAIVILIKDKKLEYLRNIDVITDQDSTTPRVYGLETVSESRLVVVDKNNDKVKLLDTNLDQIISELKLDSEPWDVSVIDEHTAAVALPWDASIQFVTISDTLSLGKKIKTRGRCAGITYWNNKLAVTCRSPTTWRWSLDILDLDGNVLNSMAPEHNGEVLFGGIGYVTVSDDQELYVSDWKHKAVYRLSVQGAVKAVYKHPGLQGLAGLTVGPGGTVYLCDWPSDSVYQLDLNSDGILKVLGKENNIEDPISMSYTGHNLYVGTDTGKVQVFPLASMTNIEQHWD